MGKEAATSALYKWICNGIPLQIHLYKAPDTVSWGNETFRMERLFNSGIATDLQRNSVANEFIGAPLKFREIQTFSDCNGFSLQLNSMARLLNAWKIQTFSNCNGIPLQSNLMARLLIFGKVPLQFETNGAFN